VDADDATANTTVTMGWDVLSSVGSKVGYAGYVQDAYVPTVKHVRYRVLKADLGRWLQRDPAGYVDGASLYEYAISSPVRMVDRTGLASGVGSGSGCGIGGAVGTLSACEDPINKIGKFLCPILCAIKCERLVDDPFAHLACMTGCLKSCDGKGVDNCKTICRDMYPPSTPELRDLCFQGCDGSKFPVDPPPPGHIDCEVRFLAERAMCWANPPQGYIDDCLRDQGLNPTVPHDPAIVEACREIAAEKCEDEAKARMEACKIRARIPPRAIIGGSGATE